MPVMNIGGSASSSFANSSSPGEWYYYSAGYHRLGLTLHLWICMPAGFLMVWQFVPAIRQKLLSLHRLSGWTIIGLVTASNVGALMICNQSFGGTVETQSGVIVLAIMVSISAFMATYNIRRLQIDQHRAWMLRLSF